MSFVVLSPLSSALSSSPATAHSREVLSNTHTPPYLSRGWTILLVDTRKLLLIRHRYFWITWKLLYHVAHGQTFAAPRSGWVQRKVSNPHNAPYCSQTVINWKTFEKSLIFVKLLISICANKDIRKGMSGGPQLPAVSNRPRRLWRWLAPLLFTNQHWWAVNTGSNSTSPMSSLNNII